MYSKEEFFLAAGFLTPEEFLKRKRNQQVKSLFRAIKQGLLEEFEARYYEGYLSRRTGKTTGLIIDSIYNQYLNYDVVFVVKNKIRLKGVSKLHKHYKSNISSNLDVNFGGNFKLVTEEEMISNTVSIYLLCRSKIIEDL